MSSDVRTERDTEVACLDDSEGNHGTYSRRLKSHMVEFQKFARWNSSLFYIVGFMIVLVVCSILAYYFLYNRDISGESASDQDAIDSCADWTGIEKTDSPMAFMTFSSAEESGNGCVTSESEKVFLKLIAGGNVEEWEKWGFECEASVQGLYLQGPFSSQSLLHFDKLFGSTVTKIILNGSELCPKVTNLEMDAIIFRAINCLSVFNATTQCDNLFHGLLEDIPKNLTTFNLKSVIVSDQLETYLAKLISSKQISHMQLEDLSYAGE